MRAFMAALLIAGAALPAAAQTRSSPNAATVAQATAACKALEQKTSHQGAVQFRRLDQLPPGVLEHAVLRSVAGCPVREIRYQGRTYYVSPSIPTFQALTPDPAK